jgi:cell division protein YceG involved in septum cleavage
MLRSAQSAPPPKAAEKLTQAAVFRRSVSGHDFSHANKANQIDVGLYRLRNNYQMAEVLKGHGFSRAASG